MLGIPIQVHAVGGLRDGFESQGRKAPSGLPVIGILGRTFLQPWVVRKKTDAIDITDSARRHAGCHPAQRQACERVRLSVSTG